MREMQNTIRETGVSVVYEPTDGDPPVVE